VKRIAIYNAKPEMVLAKEIYSRNGRLLLRKGVVLSREWIDRLVNYGVPTVYVEPEGIDLQDHEQPEDGEMTGQKARRIYRNQVPDIISAEVREDAERVVREIMNDIKTGRLIKTDKARKVVENIIDRLLKTSHIAGKLADIRILDDYTFAHSVNVCILAISTGIVMGYSRIRLRELGLGALLHDVGKMKIPDAILKKPGPLTEKEFQEIKRHTVMGYELLTEQGKISSNAARIALEHHECCNGSGYPGGIDGKKIHEYSKIVALADVYDALTADRVYKNAILPYEAMEIIIASSGYQFDPVIVRIFVENSEIYPVGSIVELNNGATGIVVNVHRALPTRPIIKLIYDSTGLELMDGTEIDMMTNTTIFVNKIVSFRKNPSL